jgi:hypothetical protein
MALFSLDYGTSFIWADNKMEAVDTYLFLNDIPEHVAVIVEEIDKHEIIHYDNSDRDIIEWSIYDGNKNKYPKALVLSKFEDRVLGSLGKV